MCPQKYLLCRYLDLRTIFAVTHCYQIITSTICSHVHITERTKIYLDSVFAVTPHLVDPIKTFLVIKDDSNYNPDLLTVPSHHKYQHRPKYGEGWTADMPFAKISEKRLAKTISIAVM